MTIREYTHFDPADGYPAGKNLYYECGRCAAVVPSMPTESSQCFCGNIRVDVDAGRFSVNDASLIRLFRSSAGQAVN